MPNSNYLNTMLLFNKKTSFLTSFFLYIWSEELSIAKFSALCCDIQIDNNVKYKYSTKLRLLKTYHEI